MSARVVSAVDTSGCLVARKRSRDDADAVRLTHEADVLTAAQHPGVVEFVRCERDDTGVALVTNFVGTHSLDTLGHVTVERAAGLIAALAETVADLHDLGIVHGRIDPSHVVIGPGGRPVLCGFAGGGRINMTPPPGPSAAPGFCDPATTDEAALTPSVDVFSLGALLRALVIECGSDVEPIPERRITLGRLRAPWSGYHRRALLTLADRATDESPLRRPPARRLAADIHDTVPTAYLDRMSEDTASASAPGAHDPEPSRGGRAATLAAIGAALVIIVFGVTGLRGGGSVAASSEVLRSTIHSAPPTSVDPASTPGCPSADSKVAVDFDGDGCPDPAYVDDSGVVVVGARRFSAGTAGDRVTLGDWNCDGVATPAVLRPATGAVFVFDKWTTGTADVSVSPTTVVIGAVDVQARDDSRSCSTLIIIRDDGTEQEIN
jgi:serine/threonine protein kinase